MENRLENRELQYRCGQCYGRNKFSKCCGSRGEARREIWPGKFMEEVITELSLGRQMGIVLLKSRLWREGKDIQIGKKQKPVQQS